MRRVIIATLMCLSSAAVAENDALHSRLLDAPEGSWFHLDAEQSMLDVPAAAVYVFLSDGVTAVQGEALIRARGGVVRSQIPLLNGLVVEIPRGSLASLGEEPKIRWVEPALPPLQTTSDDARSAVNVAPLYDSPWSLSGDGVRLGIVEVEFPDAHADLAGRLTFHGSGFTGGHPTHVAGIMAGNGQESAGQYQGMANQALIDAYTLSTLSGYLFYSNPGTLANAYSTQMGLGGAAAMNQSMGINVGLNEFPCWLLGDYGATSALLDNLVRGEQGMPFVSVWAAGNERAYDHCSALYGTVGPPACAKNVITVGAVYSNTSNPTWFSGWGPTDDGRIKPDLVAPGSQVGGDGGITSCSEGGGYSVRSGTSMATPVVTGIIGLMAEALEQASGGSRTALPSTIRMILCHTAEDRGNIGPDYQTGWGLVDAEKAVAEIAIQHWIEEEISSGEVFMKTVDLTPDQATSPLKVTMAWDDPASVPGNDAGLIDDLDLMLQAPDGTLHYPWTLQPSDPEAPAVRNSADRENNIEQVVVDQPDAGAWNIIVAAGQLQGGSQVFSLGVAPRSASTLISFDPLPEYYPRNQELEVTVRISPWGEEIVPGTETLVYWLDNGSEVSLPLVATTEPQEYTAVLPVIPCESIISFYAEVESTLTGTHTSPAGGSADPIERGVLGELDVVFLDDFTGDNGWQVDGESVSGEWTRQVPDSYCTLPSPAGGRVYMTGYEGNFYCSDLDGTTVLTSPRIVLMDPNPVISYWRFYYNDIPGPPIYDPLLVEFSIDDGVTWHLIESVYEGTIEWTYHTYDMGDYADYSPTDFFRLRFSYSTTWGYLYKNEAGIDHVEVRDNMCIPDEETCPADIAGGDGYVNVKDLLFLLAGYGLDVPEADIDGDGDVDIVDLLTVIDAWGACE
ncbi:MAG: S8 family serine peptidase [Phycisphaerales bacterium]|nr:S8 family serine peptidase [Phycisphaerales bacterium]